LPAVLPAPRLGDVSSRRGLASLGAITLALVAIHGLRPQALAAQAPGVHPNPAYIVAPVPPAFTIAMTARPVAVPFRLAASARAAFGSESDSDAVLLGNIKAVALLPSGDVVVLDDKKSELRIFGPTGAPRQRLGRAGRGPGEFFYPVSLAVDDAGRLYVGDRVRTIQVFAPSPAGYRYQRTMQNEIAAMSMCFLDTLLVVQGTALGQDPILHLYDSSGRRLRSFGALYRSPNPLLNAQIGEGQVRCDRQRGLVFYTPSNAMGIGEVRAYRADGTLVWRTALTDYHVSRIEDYGNGGVRFSAGPDGSHSVLAFVLLPGRGLLVQVAFRTEEAVRDQIPFTTLHSFLLDPATGRPLPLGTVLPPFFAARAGDAVLAFNDPFPRFEVRGVR
jgi:hypothetical protein